MYDDSLSSFINAVVLLLPIMAVTLLVVIWLMVRKGGKAR
jgi:hypothetical protein